MALGNVPRRLFFGAAVGAMMCAFGIILLVRAVVALVNIEYSGSSLGVGLIFFGGGTGLLWSRLQSIRESHRTTVSEAAPGVD